MKKTIYYILVLLCIFLCCCSIKESENSVETLKKTTSLTETPLTIITAQTMTTTQMEYSPSKEKFLEYLHEQDPQIKMDRIDWTWRLPEVIIEYGDYSIIQPSDCELYLLAYVYPLDTNSIDIDEVIWVSYEEPKDEVMFEIVNENEEKITYKYADDIKIYTFFPGTPVVYRIPVSFLSRQIEIGNNLYLIYIENDRIRTMREVYIP